MPSELACNLSTDNFPSKITGPSVWDGKILEQHPEEWVYELTSSDISDIDSAIHHFLSLNTDLTLISPETFPLKSSFRQVLEQQLQNLFHGLGFTVLRGFPVQKYERKQQVIAFMGIGSYLGTRKPQNGKGHVLGHVKDLTQGSTTKVVYDVNDPKTRIYATRKAQPFHVDGTDVVGLLALADGAEGGLSSVISSHTLYNRLQELRPDIVKLMKTPWLCDLKGEHGPEESEYIPKFPLRYFKNRLFTFWGPHFFQTITRFPGVILEDDKKEAMEYIENLCKQEALNMNLLVGDMQFVQNYQILHARTAYQDSPEATRHLLRLWLTVDPTIVGWDMPFGANDYNYNYEFSNALVVPLEAE